MSWQQYVDKSLVGTGNVNKGAIFGLNGSNWASSKNLQVSTQEIQNIIQAFNNPTGLHGTGVKLNGVKYTFLRGDGQTIYAKKGGDEGCCIAKTMQAVIVGVYSKGMLPGQCNAAVGKLQDYLLSVGY